MSTATFPVYRGNAVTAARIRLLRGQVVVREESQASQGSIWTPDPKLKTEARYGRVLAMGPPAFFDYSGRRVEVPHGFDLGDRVVFAWVSNPHHYTLPWPLDGLPAAWLPQGSVLGVVE